MTAKRPVIVSVTCLGISSLTTQIISLREFLAVFAGNELVIGIILGNWLLLTGLGSFLGRFTTGLARPTAWLVWSQVTIALLPFFQVSAVRLLKQFFVPGLILGLNQAFLASLLILAPYCLVSGFLLTLFAGIGGTKRDAGQIGQIYVVDVIGDIIGGLLFSFLLIHLFSAFQTITFLMLSNLLAAILLSRDLGHRRLAVLVMGILLTAGALIGGLDFEKLTSTRMFAGQHLVHKQTTPYGSLVVTKSNGQATVYENGVPVGSSRNLPTAEETVHYGLAQHPDPQDVLLISGGLNGALDEAGKYGLRKIEYVELDPLVIRLVKILSPPAANLPIDFISEDPRRLIRSQKDAYDAILIDLGDPATAQLNRFYTVEFFREVRRALRPGGILSFSLSGAENYAGPEIRSLAAAIHRSLAESFPNILLIPGGRQFFIAAARPLDYRIAEKLKEKNIKTSYVNQDYLRARLTEDRLAAAREMISGPAPLNRDFHPSSYFAHLRYWLARFQGSLLLPVLTIAGLLAAIILLLSRIPAKRPAAAALCATGFTGMGLEIVLLLAFQAMYGYVFQQLGIIVTAFLIGTAAGAFWAGRKSGDQQILLFRLDLGLGCLALLLPQALMLLQAAAFQPGGLIPLVAFPLLTAGTGLLLGAQLPPAARLIFSSVEDTAANLYALDFLGAALGALTITAFAVPLLGVSNTCYLLGGLKLCSAAGLRLQDAPSAAQRPRPANDPRPTMTLAIVLAVFLAQGFAIVNQATSTAIYAFSFIPALHWLVLLLAAAGIIRAIRAAGPYQPPGRQTSGSGILKKINALTRLPAARWLNYLGFSLVVFYPIFRCYFKVPYLFCHVCPRQCLFGYLRPYLVPAALIMNLEKRWWCFHCCPIGTLHDCQARVAGRPWDLPKIFSIVPLAVLGFTVLSYFKLQKELRLAEPAGHDWYTALFINSFAVTPAVLISAAAFILLAFRLRRSFCRLACPVGNLSKLLLKLEKSGTSSQ